MSESGVETGQAARAQQQLPHSLEAEQAVLGGLMLAGDKAFDSVASILKEDDFFRAEHRLIFTTLARLAEEREPFDPITVCDDLNNRKQLNKAGGAGYVSELAANTPSAANIQAYARIVREQATLRQLIGAATEIITRSYNPDGSEANQLLDEAEQRFIDISEDRPRDEGFQDLSELLQDTVDRIEEIANSGGGLTGISSGFNDLDDKTSGWQKADLIVVAARPSMGKTAFALNMAEHALLHDDRPIVIFSLEMPAQSLVMRMLSSLGRIPLKHIRDGKLSKDEWDRLIKAATRLKTRKLFIDDTPGLTPIEVRARTRRLVREHGTPALVMLDYLQLMRVAGATEGRTQEISEISRSLKQVAREFDCPLIALSQLNRGVEQRPNKRPMNSDLRESGAIEQDADIILFIYRDEYYNEDSPDQGVAEIIIGKQRNGEIGTCKLQFQGEFTRFNNLARDYFNS